MIRQLPAALSSKSPSPAPPCSGAEILGRGGWAAAPGPAEGPARTTREPLGPVSRGVPFGGRNQSQVAPGPHELLATADSPGPLGPLVLASGPLCHSCRPWAPESLRKSLNPASLARVYLPAPPPLGPLPHPLLTMAEVSPGPGGFSSLGRAPGSPLFLLQGFRAQRHLLCEVCPATWGSPALQSPCPLSRAGGLPIFLLE